MKDSNDEKANMITVATAKTNERQTGGDTQCVNWSRDYISPNSKNVNSKFLVELNSVCQSVLKSNKKSDHIGMSADVTLWWKMEATTRLALTFEFLLRQLWYFTYRRLISVGAQIISKRRPSMPKKSTATINYRGNDHIKSFWFLPLLLVI